MIHIFFVFLEVSLLTGTQQLTSIRASGTCNVFVLSKDDLKEILEEFVEMRVLMEHSSIVKILDLCQKVKKFRKEEGFSLNFFVTQS